MAALLYIRKTAIESTRERKLVTTNIKVTKKYLKIVEQKFQKQNIFEQTNKLYQQWRTKEKNRWETKVKYKTLDVEIFNICKTTEKMCKHSVSGIHEWSPKLVDTIHKISYWRPRLKYPRENLVVIQLGKAIGISYQDLSKEVIISYIKQSREQLKRYKNNWWNTKNNISTA